MQTSSNIRVGDLEVRPHERTLLVKGEPIELTSKEFDIVMTLAEHPGWVFSADQLSGSSDTGDFSPESVSVLVSRVRQKLSAVDASDAVETVRGLGYRLSSRAGDDARVELACRELRDSWWQLQEAIIEAGHAGTPEQQRQICSVLDGARRAIYADLAE